MFSVYSRYRCGAAAAMLLFAGGPVAGAERISFSRDVQPILSDNCYFCHGPDANHREAGLRLDREEEAAAVVEPNESEASELVRRIISADPGELMPPPESNRSLSEQEIQLLRRWIDEGAQWGVHWSLAPLESPAVPAADTGHTGPGQSLAANPIDAFVAAKLGERDWQFAPEASRETLIRRLSLDLTGLPPTPAEVASFLDDRSPLAYENLVDRLLQSPAYGERMAWDWLDAARYADTNGYQGDGERTMWPWRDWVVRAFNQNLSYDQFTIWQLAGDLLPEASFDQRLATGFSRNHMINGEGGRIPEENRVDYVMDMTETVGTVWLGLTVNCCRCHDHKFDPLSQRDYYSLFAFFNQTPVDGSGGNPQTPPVLAAPTAEQEQRIAATEHALVTVRSRMAERARQLAPGQGEWEQQTLAEAGGDWHLLTPHEVAAVHQTLEVLPDQSVLAGGPNPDSDTYTVTAAAGVERIAAIRLEALRHETMTQGGLSRSGSGNFVLTEFEVLLQPPGESAPRPVAISSGEATFEQGDLKIQAALDGNPRTGWAVYEGRPVDRDHTAVFRLSEPLEIPAGAELIFRLQHDSQHVNHNLGRFRLSVTPIADAPLADSLLSLRAALQEPAERRTAEQKVEIERAFLQTDADYVSMQSEGATLEERLKAVRDQIPKVMVMADRPEPRPTFVLSRGLYTAPEEEVAAEVPAMLPPLSADQPRNRLGLAEWLVSPENPLTARVTVNRFWQQLFGIGLVKTADDFGVQGEIPLHADLLDWLAADFRDRDWDVKALLRRMVTSRTYRQSSAARFMEEDPENRWMARGPRFRMPSWMLRDQALAASGLLVASQGGRPVNGYQPAGVWEEATFGNKTYRQDAGAALYRRSLLTFWRRIIAPTMFFDNASRQTCTVKGLRTNTPLHALLTLNDVTYVEAARALAQQALVQPPVVHAEPRETTDAARIQFVFARVLARSALEAEQKVLLAGLHRTRREFAADPDAAESLLAVGESPRDPALGAVEHAAWTALCLAVLNLDETLTKE